MGEDQRSGRRWTATAPTTLNLLSSPLALHSAGIQGMIRLIRWPIQISDRPLLLPIIRQAKLQGLRASSHRSHRACSSLMRSFSKRPPRRPPAAALAARSGGAEIERNENFGNRQQRKQEQGTRVESSMPWPKVHNTQPNPGVQRRLNKKGARLDSTRLGPTPLKQEGRSARLDSTRLDRLSDSDEHDARPD